jgi:methylenetetrahydrofolate--tRNA-(uracil-5-)-methyltransferase
MATGVNVLIIGAGLAGSEAANLLANSKSDIKVHLVECKRKKPLSSQKSQQFAELVCTNSLKSKNPDSGHGLLKYEMEKFGSIILKTAYQHEVPAGDALAVDREKFSTAVTDKLMANDNIEIHNEEVADPIACAKKYDCQYIIIASGPLTSEPLQNWMTDHISKEDFYFYDAIAPVVDADSLNNETLYFKDRHKDINEINEDNDVIADYLNVPLNKEQYLNFIQELVLAEKVPPQSFEKYQFFEACLPVDLMAERGKDTARFSCMKPIGLEQVDGNRPWACVQLRRENLLGDAYNMVGFQTRLTYKEQVRIFRTLPGFEKAEFIHLGSVHRNSFLNSKKLLNSDLSSKEFPHIYFAGQITGVEGYTESSSMGLYAAIQLLQKINNKPSLTFPITTGMGALINFIMTVPKPVPSSINFGLLPPIALTKEERKDRTNRKKVKKAKASKRAREDFDLFISENLKDIF